jgi:hypothetical protein
MTCLDCDTDISYRAHNTKRCKSCAKIRGREKQLIVWARYNKKRRSVNMVCWTCGIEFVGSGNKDWCSFKCIDGPEKPKVKIYNCRRCGDETINSLYCNDCRRSHADVESMTEHRR